MRKNAREDAFRLLFEQHVNPEEAKEKLEKTQIQFIISFSASQMLILNPSRYKREGTEQLLNKKNRQNNPFT